MRIKAIELVDGRPFLNVEFTLKSGRKNYYYLYQNNYILEIAEDKNRNKVFANSGDTANLAEIVKAISLKRSLEDTDNIVLEILYALVITTLVRATSHPDITSRATLTCENEIHIRQFAELVFQNIKEN